MEHPNHDHSVEEIQTKIIGHIVGVKMNGVKINRKQKLLINREK